MRIKVDIKWLVADSVFCHNDTMAISDKDRKLLWGRSHNRCAFCGALLSVPERPNDRAAIVADEAHIVSAAPNGPRSTVPIDYGIDSYENFILLCRTHHKMVDDQPNEFTVERLLNMKRSHERESEARFADSERLAPPPPIRVRVDPSAPDTPFTWMQNGSEVWDVIADAQAWRLEPLRENDSSEIQQDAADEFLTLAQDYGNVSFDVALNGLSAVRRAKREFGEQLETLHQLGLVVFGRRLRRILTGGFSPDEYWMQGELVVMRLDSEMLIDQAEDSERPIV